MILVNGIAAASVAATDRGLAYGDGVFRTLIRQGGRLRAWERHLQKLKHDCAALGIECPAEELFRDELARAAESADEVVKLIVTRGSGARGYAPPPAPVPTRIVMTGPVPRYPDDFLRRGVVVHACRTRFSFQPRLAGVKHLNRLENVLARAEWSDPDIAEGLVSDEDGNIVSGTMMNLFIAEGGRLVTPDLSRCGVAGVTRETILQRARAAGIPCAEEPITPARLLDAEEVVLVNTVAGAWQVRAYAQRAWSPGRWITAVRKWLDEEAG